MNMTKLFTSVLTTVGVLVSLSLAASRVQAAEAPNIVLIMSDDMGFSDIGCYGGEINTPHLDQLANDGLRFSQFYNTARCCPTRAALLSGVYQHQAGIGLMTGEKNLPGYRGELGRNVVSIAEATPGGISRELVFAAMPSGVMQRMQGAPIPIERDG